MPPPAVFPVRHFLGWDRPWLPAVVDWLVADWPGRGPIDLSAALVVVPTRQAGRRLREALADRAAGRGTAVFPPLVLTPDAVIARELGADVATRLECLLAWTTVLRALDPAEFRAVFPVDPPERTFGWALRLAGEMVRLQVTLAEAGLALGDVVARAGSPFIETERWLQLAELERQFRSLLSAQGRRDPQATRLAAASGAPGGPSHARIAVLGVPDLSPLGAARLGVFAAGTPIAVVVGAPAAEADGFDAWGRPLPAAWEGRELEISSFNSRVHLCADPAEQAARLAALAVASAARPGGLALGVADPEVAPLLENELSRQRLPAFNPEGRSVRGAALFEFLRCLSAVARSPTFEAVAALARCPDFLASLRERAGGEEFSAARWLAGLDELRTRHLPGDLDAARGFARGASEFSTVEAGLAAMVELRSRLRGGTFAATVAVALREIFARRQLDLAREEDAQWHEVAAAWRDVLEECGAAEARFGALRPDDGWELALGLFGEQRSVAEKRPGAIELQGWLELLWEDAPHLAIAGLNDGRVPEGVREDPFLPPALRQQLGLRTDAERLARDAYLLQAISACRRHDGRLDLLLSKASASGDPLRPSRLLLRCPDAELPSRIAQLFRSPPAPGATASWTRAWKIAPGALPPPERVAVTALRRYLLCPFRFYLQYVRRMSPVDPGKSELDAFDFGTLCHAALEQLGRDPDLRATTDAGRLRDGLIRHFERSVHERFGRWLALPLVVQVESARQRLAKLAELQAAERAAGWEIIEVERPFALPIAGLVVRGKIDRIDRHAGTGEVRVLDYKTSDTPVTPAEAHLRPLRADETVPDWARVETGEKPAGWMDLQLPLYLHALAPEFGPRLACGYFNLPKATGATALALWDDYPPALHESAWRCAEGVCAAIRRGEFWPPNLTIRPERDDFAALFHHGVEESVEWPPR